MVAAWLAGFGPPPADASATVQLRDLREAVKAAHFCVAQSGSTTIRAFTRNVAAQLAENTSGFREAAAVDYSPYLQISVDLHAEVIEAGSHVTGVNVGQVTLNPPTEEATFDSGLCTPLDTLYAKGYDKHMILLVDALDEALTRTPPRGELNLVQLLAKLDDLPEKVRILVTTRRDPRVLKEFNDTEYVDLIEDAPVGTEDLREFVYKHLISVSGEQRNRLATRIADAADGNFLYAHLVVSVLIPKLATLGDQSLLELPEGLSGLYSAFLNRDLGADEDRWHREFKVMLGLIAVAQAEGLTLAQLNAITGLDSELSLRRCQQYLDGEPPSGPFRPFHRSFALFLLEDEKNTHYRVDPMAMHRRIADYYCSTFGSDWYRCDGYGLEHLATHLFHLRDGDRLLNLLNRDRVRIRYRRSNYSYMGLAEDVGLTLRTIQEEDWQRLSRGIKPSRIGGQVYCALLLTSINSVAEKLSPSLLAALAHQKEWTPMQALAHARRISDVGLRLNALLTLAMEFSELRHDVFQELATLALNIRDNERRCEALTKLVPYLSGSQLVEVLLAAVNAIRQLSDTSLKPQQGYYQVHMVPEHTGVRTRHLEELSRTLYSLWPAGAVASSDAQLRAACEIDDSVARKQSIAELASQLKGFAAEPGVSAGQIQGILLANTLQTQTLIGDDEQRAMAIARLAKYLDGTTDHSGGDAAQPHPREVQSWPAGDAALLPETSDGIRKIGVQAYLERAANARVSPRLPLDLVPEALGVLKKLNEVSKHTSAKITVRSIVALAPYLDDQQLSEAAEIVDSIYAPFGYNPDKIEAEFSLAKRKDEPERSETAKAIWQKLSTMSFDNLVYDMIPFLADLAAHLPQPQRQEVFDRLERAVRGAVHRGRGYLTWNLNIRAGLATELLSHSPDEERLQLGKLALETVSELKNATPIQPGSYAQVRWEAIARNLPKELLMDAEALDPEGYIPSHLPAPLLAEALTVSRNKKNVKWLLSLAARLPESLFRDALATAQAIGGDRLRAELMAMMPAISKLTPLELYSAWVNTLDGMANLSRPEFLNHLSSFAPILMTLGGTDAVKNTSDVIQDIGTWWL